MDYNYDSLRPLEFRGEKLPLPLSDEHREFLMNKGQDIRVRNADQLVAAHEHRQRVLAAQQSERESDVEVDPDDNYINWSTEELKTEIDARNEGREAGNKISKDGKKADLARRLEEDDATEA